MAQSAGLPNPKAEDLTFAFRTLLEERKRIAEIFKDDISISTID